MKRNFPDAFPSWIFKLDNSMIKGNVSEQRNWNPWKVINVLSTLFSQTNIQSNGISMMMMVESECRGKQHTWKFQFHSWRWCTYKDWKYYCNSVAWSQMHGMGLDFFSLNNIFKDEGNRKMGYKNMMGLQPHLSPWHPVKCEMFSLRLMMILFKIFKDIFYFRL